MIQKYLTYLAIFVVAGLIGAFLANRYSSSAIAALKAEIESERKKSMEAIKVYEKEISSQDTIIQNAKERGHILEREIISIRKKRAEFKTQIDTTFKIFNTTDELLDSLRRIYN